MNKFKQRLTAYLHGRNFPSAVLTAIIIAAVVFLNIIVSTLGSHLGLYLYDKAEDDLSISSAADAVFAKAIEAGERVTVTFCMYEDVIASHTTGKFVKQTAEEFEKRYPELISIRYVNILTQLDSDGDFFDFTPYKTDMRGNETTLSRYSVIFECGSNYRVLTDTYTGAGFADFFTLDSSLSATSYNGEEVFASMVSWVLRDEHKTAYFTTGHSETSNATLYSVLACAGYYVEQINLRKVDKVPDDAGLIVISNPISDFERTAEGSSLRSEIERLRAYAERGGSFFITLDPYSKETPVLCDFMKEFGITVNRTEAGDSLIVKDDNNAITTDGFTLIAEYGDGDVPTAMEQKTADSGSVIVRDAASMTLDPELGAEAMLLSSESSVCQAAGVTVDSDGSYVIAAYSRLENDNGTEARMFVVPSVYLTATDAIVTNGYSNKDFIYSLCDVLYGAGDMIYGCKTIVYDDGILENLTMGMARVYTSIFIAIPVLLAVSGAVVIIRRKNR